MNFNVLELYPTPVYLADFQETQIEKVQEELLFVFDSLKQKQSFSYKENWGTHKLSETTFTSNLLSEYNCTNFLEVLDLHIGQYLMYSCRVSGIKYTITQSWMTLYTERDYAHIHNHGSSHISGCYYIKTNGDDGDFMIPCSQVPLETNRVFANMTRTTNIKPQVGRLLLFPGWMNHGVGTNATDNERVSLSFNITLNDSEPVN